MFADGPRQAISMESTFEFGAAKIVNGAPALPDSHQRALNWSAVRDEVQDFTRNVRAVSGGGGLIGPMPMGGGARRRRGPRAAARSAPDRQLRLNADLDAIATYLALGVRAPISPFRARQSEPGSAAQSSKRRAARTATAGSNWTISSLDYTPPAIAPDVVDAQLVRFLCRVGTFDPASSPTASATRSAPTTPRTSRPVASSVSTCLH